jgi:transcriptional regulator with XRE-family HTH domain
VTPSKRPEPYLPPGAARDLVDLFRLLRNSSQLRIGQIATRTGYTPSHISEVLRGWKSPSPDAAAKIAQALGADEATISRARRRAEDLREWKRSEERRARAPQAQDDRAAPALIGFPLAHRLAGRDVMVRVIVGDLFEQETHLAVGFSDTFDTSIADNRIINRSSLQGQLLQRLFASDQRQLDDQLAAALADVAPVRTESPRDKRYGKLARYPLGTVAVLGRPDRLIFAVAYGLMGNDLLVRAPVEGLWHCFAQLWESVYRHGQRRPLSIPLMGSGLARVDTMDRQNLLHLILLSFAASSRLRISCHELRIVILPGDVQRVDTASLRSFLQAL